MIHYILDRRSFKYDRILMFTAFISDGTIPYNRMDYEA